jgi:hypothetical protein
MDDQVRNPSKDDRDWLGRAEQHILGLLRKQYSEVALDHTEKDLHLAQRLLDDKAVGRKHALELQCLGIVLGNVFAANTSMQWARVVNEFGDQLALHSREIGFTLYPLTMISKRVEDRRQVDMPALYRSFVADLGL